MRGGRRVVGGTQTGFRGTSGVGADRCLVGLVGGGVGVAVLAFV